VQDARVARGQSEVPRIAVVSRSCDFDWSSPFFTEARERPAIVTVASAPARGRDAAAAVADVVLAGEEDVDLGAALIELGAPGVHVLAEGGPTLNGALAQAGLLDELCVSLSPLLASGDAKRLIAGSALDKLERLRLHSVCEADDYLFLRYRPAR
jgi:riboflavin biosynthesis pyrimidine reductase